MKPFEHSYLMLQPVLPPLGRMVRRQLLQVHNGQARPLRLLDAGGRKSHCTIGVPAEICVTDIPRKSEIQKMLHLGVTESIFQQMLQRRSNVRWVVFDDMTQSSFAILQFRLRGCRGSARTRGKRQRVCPGSQPYSPARRSVCDDNAEWRFGRQH